MPRPSIAVVQASATIIGQLANVDSIHTVGNKVAIIGRYFLRINVNSYNGFWGVYAVAEASGLIYLEA